MEGAVRFYVPPDIWIASALAALAFLAHRLDPPAEIADMVLLTSVVAAAAEFYWLKRRKG